MPITTSLRFPDACAYARIAAELYRRSASGATESGCFVLGRTLGADRTADEVVYFDDIDPEAYRFGAIRFDTTKLSLVYDICEAKNISIVGDMHVHPGTAFLSPIDEAHPVIAVAGHVSIILPYDGRYRTTRQIALNVYEATGRWTEVPRNRCATFLGLDRASSAKEAYDRIDLLLTRRGLRHANRLTLLERTQIGVVADRTTCKSMQGQAALLTTIALCTRFARGGVFVRLSDDAPLHALPGTRLSHEVQRLGGEPWCEAPENVIAFGRSEVDTRSFCVRPWSLNGEYGCTSAAAEGLLEDDYVPGAVAAASLAVAEVFRYRVMGKTEVAPRQRGLRLWTPNERVALPKDLTSVANALWLLGFGHLGNSYGWTIALTRGWRPRILVQDPQRLDVANASTQLFAVPADVGTPKVQLAARELSRYGLTVQLDPRAIDDQYVPAAHPDIVLGGLDHVAPRRALSKANVSLIVDAGLGSTETTFSQFTIRTLLDAADASDMFQDVAEQPDLDARVATNPFAEMDDDTPEVRCGLLALADTAVAVPFVGAVVAPIVLTQVLRHRLNLPLKAVVSGDVLGDLPSLV